MLHVLTVFTVNPDSEDAIVHSIRAGEWHKLARRLAPALVATDLLRHLHHMPERLYLCLDFWASPDAYRRAFHSPAVQRLLLARRQMTASASKSAPSPSLP